MGYDGSALPGERQDAARHGRRDARRYDRVSRPDPVCEDRNRAGRPVPRGREDGYVKEQFGGCNTSGGRRLGNARDQLLLT